MPASYRTENSLSLTDANQITTFQAFINAVMKKILLELDCDSRKALNILYRECHPCVTTIFSSSKDFFLKMTAVVDYILQILPALMMFRLTMMKEMEGTCIFIGENREAPFQHEAWVFVTLEQLQSPSFRADIQRSLNNISPISPPPCSVYCLENGEMIKI
ncbi:hypothetical protein SAMN05421736_101283 [Evansella caseinilytica]|uniref:Uncharacterized protein n=1 Tax=Evansella caseinilytica TaxID=1503961 RepID=A0A1H3GWG3_9BACI|nr:hypothetical protein [Evansella caseinilytica]SDY06689.1 hypothetical protein SAMN05421736_101283 [Evansella caseinilytica]